MIGMLVSCAASALFVHAAVQKANALNMATASTVSAAYSSGFSGSGWSSAAATGTAIALRTNAHATPGSAMLASSSRSRAWPVRIRLSTSSSRRLTNCESTL